MGEEQIRKKYNITGCEHCPYFVGVVIKDKIVYYKEKMNEIPRTYRFN